MTRIVRGSGWFHAASTARAVVRPSTDPGFVIDSNGFRLAADPPRP